MADIKLNTTYTITMSPDSISEYQEMLERKKKQLSQIAENVVRKVSEIGLQSNHNSAELLPVKNDGYVVSGGIRTTDPKDTYKEYGTGIVGSANPHPDIISGWIYDVNKHGEKGWRYPKGDGTYGWTKGLPSSKKFYIALQRMEKNMPIIAKEEFNK